MAIKNAPVSILLSFFSSALHLSVLNENTPLFDLLLKYPGLSVDMPTQEGHTALRFALLRDNFGEDSLSSRLLAAKANPNPMYPATGDTLLHMLAKEKKEEAAVFLCSKGLIITFFSQCSL